MKVYKVYAAAKFLFDGNNETYIKVTKETKDRIYGILVENFRGNYGMVYNDRFTDPPYVCGRKLTIIKANVAGWIECEDASKRKK